MPLAARSGYSPSGIFHAYSPVFRLIALSVPHGGATPGYPSGSRNLWYPVKRYFGRGPEGSSPASSLFSPLRRYLATAVISSAFRFGNEGIRPAPSRITVPISSSVRLVAKSRSDGIDGGAPASASPWQLAQFAR